ncbi:iron-sulfur cluster insertion protein ErpA [Buchnera aphidicola]|uniref:Iron-sulfur cluster insertion protein ErpA n=2 Tax=Buchnera aphidicola TaxID=9 RepID=ERPA_BUCA5|nr:iron-sulfur cluster insertion protein ErpA [Buchnera aphidicola]B8D7B5.1 RecName: Full=Iron-sulfur cluster insertion protein ErpA [Buchnera aphidicola str. Tuc7 (Acyrthosiphon pisum)]B8D910.1 RecName: Full=Iron-sulfur cluster insertion protein ErpA [Buchnera aphidicola str. 5A (Acyrthosiphon pisum)]ADP66608.1 iron-sulfur cluster insertion protein ErpA [Buchnera aphidicola str. TLW03 (Acyrthosiphon pisum)]ADP67732.1 iron-sulfur cluster insertion protein ErpA [Buchnera aphidicola str. JF98 (Ac
MENAFKSHLQFTEKAIKKIKNLIEIEKNHDLKLRIYINGGGCSGFQYQFIFDTSINEDDIIITQSEVSLIIDPISLQYLYGGQIDYLENLEGSKFIVSNPNAKNTCGCGSSFSI